MSAPRVLIVPRPEREDADLYVVRHGVDGEREAFVVGKDGDTAPITGWHPVAPGSEAHLLTRLDMVGGGVDLFDLDRALEPVRRNLRTNAL